MTTEQVIKKAIPWESQNLCRQCTCVACNSVKLRNVSGASNMRSVLERDTARCAGSARFRVGLGRASRSLQFIRTLGCAYPTNSSQVGLVVFDKEPRSGNTGEIGLAQTSITNRVIERKLLQDHAAATSARKRSTSADRRRALT